MNLIARQGFWNAIAQYLGIAAGFVNMVLLFPNFLEVDQVGLTRVLINASIIYAQLSALGGTHMIIRFFPYFRTEDKHHKGFLFLTHLLFFLGFLLVSFFVFLFKPVILSWYIKESPLFIDHFNLLIPLAFFTLYFDTLEAYSKSIYRSVAPAFIRQVMLRLLVSATIALYAFNLVSFEIFLNLFIGVNCLATVLLLFYLFLQKEINFRLPSQTWRPKVIKMMLVYGFFVLLGGITNTLTITLDSLMLGAMAGLEDVGVYATVAFMVTAMMVPARSFERIAFPLVSDFWKKKSVDKIERLYKKLSLANLASGLFVFILIWINLDVVFGFMPEIYSTGRYVFLWTAMARLFDMATSINGIIILTSKYYRVETLFNVIFAATMIGFNLLLIPQYGINGAAFATFLSMTLFNAYRLVYVRYKFGLQPFEAGFAKALVIAGVTLVLSTLIPSADSWVLNLFLQTFICGTTYLGLSYLFKINPEWNEMALNVLRNRRF